MIASRRSVEMFTQRYIRDIRISKRLEEKWGRPFPTSRQIILEKNRKRRDRKNLQK